MNTIKKLGKGVVGYFNSWTLFEKLWLGLFTLVGFYLYFAWNDTLIGLIALLSGMFCVVLVAKGKRSNYIPNFINSCLYAYIAYGSKLYGEVMLNALYYVPMAIIGYVMWSRNLSDGSKDDVIVKMLSNPKRIGIAILSAFCIYLYGLWLQRLGGNFPLTDATSTVLSVIATLLLVFRFAEQWYLWITVNVVSIVMWVGVYLQDGTGASMIVMWSAFLINAMYGAYNWWILSEKQKIEVSFKQQFNLT